MSTAIFASRTTVPAVAMLVVLPTVEDVIQPQFEDCAPLVLDDDDAAAERDRVEGVPRKDIAAAPRRLLCCFGNVGKVDAVLVQNSHLSTFEVEEISGHFCSGARSARGRISPAHYQSA